MGLVEKEWLDTLPTIDPKEVTYTDFIKTGNKLATQLRNEVSNFVHIWNFILKTKLFRPRQTGLWFDNSFNTYANPKWFQVSE